MYRLGKQTDKHRRGRHVVIGLIVFVIVLSAIYILMHLKIAPDQQIRNSAPISQSTDSANSKKVTIDKPLFTLELPAGWHEVAVGNLVAVPPSYSFRSPAKQSLALDLYIDNIPITMGINRAIVVSTQVNGLAYDNVSENCTTFTESSLTNPQTGTAAAKWQATNFICDMSNAGRAVVGTVSTEGINQVTARGEKSGTHKFFLTYTDNNISPNYSTLYAILGSLHFK